MTVYQSFFVFMTWKNWGDLMRYFVECPSFGMWFFFMDRLVCEYLRGNFHRYGIILDCQCDLQKWCWTWTPDLCSGHLLSSLYYFSSYCALRKDSVNSAYLKEWSYSLSPRSWSITQIIWNSLWVVYLSVCILRYWFILLELLASVPVTKLHHVCYLLNSDMTPSCIPLSNSDTTPSYVPPFKFWYNPTICTPFQIFTSSLTFQYDPFYVCLGLVPRSCISSKWPYIFCWGMIWKTMICDLGVLACFCNHLAAKQRDVCVSTY